MACPYLVVGLLCCNSSIRMSNGYRITSLIIDKDPCINR